MTECNPIDMCVLSYNRAKFTRLCLKEIAKRTRYPRRVIVVNV